MWHVVPSMKYYLLVDMGINSVGERKEYFLTFVLKYGKMEFTSFMSDFENLPKDIQKQLIEYAECLKAKYMAGKKSTLPKEQLSFSWENGLKNLKKDYSSVDLQHKINDLR